MHILLGHDTPQYATAHAYACLLTQLTTLGYQGYQWSNSRCVIQNARRTIAPDVGIGSSVPLRQSTGTHISKAGLLALLYGRSRGLVLQPGVLERHLSSRPLLRVHGEEVEQEVSAAPIRLWHAPADAGLLGVQVLIAVLQGHTSVTCLACRCAGLRRSLASNSHSSLHLMQGAASSAVQSRRAAMAGRRTVRELRSKRAPERV